jgi:hypothetical protein
MGDRKGSCHCGAVTFSVDLPSLDGLVACNCSICGRTGAIMAFLPQDKLTELTGKDKLTDYQFGKQSIHHTFCSICGVRPYASGKGSDGNAWAMVNVRCLDDVDTHELAVAQKFDGKAL